MSFPHKVFSLAIATMAVAPIPAWAIGGGPGCSNLPEYDRAVGALQGNSTCDMSVEQARRIISAVQGGAGGPHHRHYKVAPQP